MVEVVHSCIKHDSSFGYHFSRSLFSWTNSRHIYLTNKWNTSDKKIKRIRLNHTHTQSFLRRPQKRHPALGCVCAHEYICKTWYTRRHMQNMGRYSLLAFEYICTLLIIILCLHAEGYFLNLVVQTLKMREQKDIAKFVLQLTWFIAH